MVLMKGLKYYDNMQKASWYLLSIQGISILAYILTLNIVFFAISMTTALIIFLMMVKIKDNMIDDLLKINKELMNMLKETDAREEKEK